MHQMNQITFLNFERVSGCVCFSLVFDTILIVFLCFFCIETASFIQGVEICMKSFFDNFQFWEFLITSLFKFSQSFFQNLPQFQYLGFILVFAAQNLKLSSNLNANHTDNSSSFQSQAYCLCGFQLFTWYANYPIVRNGGIFVT